MAPKSDTIVFRPLWFVTEERNAFGLRTNDYPRYRKHCAQKAHRLRGSLKMTHGKGKEFKSLPAITTANVTVGHLQLLLVEAERAWAFGQENQKLAVESDDSTHHHRAISRFRRALHWNDKIVALTTELYSAGRMTAWNFVECCVYSLVLHGNIARVREDFEPALEQLAVAKYALDNLVACAATSRDQALATSIADDISPEIRYCAHEMGRARAYDIDAIVKGFTPEHCDSVVPSLSSVLKRVQTDSKAVAGDSNKQQLKTLLWEGTPVPVRNPELVDVLLRVQEAEAKLEAEVKHDRDSTDAKAATSRNRVARFDAVLSSLSDAEEVARKLIEAQQLSGTSAPSPTPGARDLQFLHSYLVYRHLSRRIQRDLALSSALLASSPSTINDVTTSENAADLRVYPAVIKVLETVLQSLEQMRGLTVVDESEDLASAVESRISYTRTRKCLYLAKTYASCKKFAEAVSLTQRARLYIREAQSTLVEATQNSATDDALLFFPLSSSHHLQPLEKDLDDTETRFKRAWFAYNGGDLTSQEDTSKKPLFFDIALNYVNVPMDSLLQRAGKAPQPPAPKATVKPAETKEPVKEQEVVQEAARGGLSSLLGGWWGRK